MFQLVWGLVLVFVWSYLGLCSTQVLVEEGTGHVVKDKYGIMGKCINLIVSGSQLVVLVRQAANQETTNSIGRKYNNE